MALWLSWCYALPLRDCANAVAAAQEVLARVNQEFAQGRILPTTVDIGFPPAKP